MVYQTYIGQLKRVSYYQIRKQTWDTTRDCLDRQRVACIDA